MFKQLKANAEFYGKMMNDLSGEYLTDDLHPEHDGPISRADLNNFEKNTLIIWGRHDSMLPVDIGHYLHEHIPGSSKAVLDDCGHCPQVERPWRTAYEVNKFLQPFVPAS